MKRFSEQFNKQANSVKMRAAEKRELKERLLSYIEYHPLPKTTAQVNAARYIKSDSFTLVRVNTPALRGIIGALTILVLVVVPVVAERAVPGDALYAIKVNINEEIRSSLAVSPYAQVEWETQRLERRIAEARLLASEGKLTEEVEAEVAEAVKAHADAAHQGIAAIRETDSDEAAIAGIAFESALAVQSEVLEGTLKKEAVVVGNASGTPGHSVAGLATLVAQTHKSASESQADVAPSYERLAARVEFETSRAYELFASIKEVASEEEIADIERRLSDIERAIATAAEAHIVTIDDTNDNDNDESIDTIEPEILPEVAMLRSALTDLQKLISFMTDIDVREHVAIETLVPVVLTEEERIERLATQEQSAQEQLGELTERFVQRDETAETDEKIARGLETVATELAEANTAREAGDLDTAEAHMENALALLEDLASLLEQETPEDLVEIVEEPATTTPAVIEDETSSTTSTTTDAGVSDETTGTSTEVVAE